MPGTPKNEVERDTVPQPDQDHGAHLSDENNRRCGYPVVATQFARQGEEEIAPEPLGQRHMPVIPELGQVGFEVGSLEVLWELKSQQQTGCDGDLGVARKIEIDLPSVGDQHDLQPAS